jgi:hypothetical protein
MRAVGWKGKVGSCNCLDNRTVTSGSVALDRVRQTVLIRRLHSKPHRAEDDECNGDLTSTKKAAHGKAASIKPASRNDERSVVVKQRSWLAAGFQVCFKNGPIKAITLIMALVP